MKFLSQPDLMLYKFEYNTMIARGHENHVLNYFCLGEELVRDAVCFFGKSYKWLVLLSEEGSKKLDYTCVCSCIILYLRNSWGKNQNQHCFYCHYMFRKFLPSSDSNKFTTYP